MTDGDSASTNPSVPSNATTTLPRVVAMSVDSLKLELQVPSSAKSGAMVPIVLHLDNTGTEPIELYLRGRTIAFDIFVTSAAGDTVWHRLEDVAIDASLQLRTLAPSERLTLTDQWDQRTNAGAPIPPGEYTVQAHVLTDRPDPITFPVRTIRIGD